MATASAATATRPALVPADPFELVGSEAVVAVAMSGGVDSSVAAARCVGRGLTTAGITLAMWPAGRERLRDRGCCSIDAVEDARRVANQLGIRHLVWNLEAEFSAEVIAPFEDGYAAGLTPNPACAATSGSSSASSWSGPGPSAPPTWPPGTTLASAAGAAPGHCTAASTPARIRRTPCIVSASASWRRRSSSGSRPEQGPGASRGGQAGPGHGRQADFPGALLRRGRDAGRARPSARRPLPTRRDLRPGRAGAGTAPRAPLLHGGAAQPSRHRPRPPRCPSPVRPRARRHGQPAGGGSGPMRWPGPGCAWPTAAG